MHSQRSRSVHTQWHSWYTEQSVRERFRPFRQPQRPPDALMTITSDTTALGTHAVALMAHRAVSGRFRPASQSVPESRPKRVSVSQLA